MRGYSVLQFHNNPRTLFPHLPLMITVIFLSLIGISPAWAENLGIQITSPTPNSIFYNSTVEVAGTWSDDNASSIPQIAIGTTDQGLVSPSITGHNWVVFLTGLNPGWHTLEASISDQITGKTDERQIVIITGHMSQPKLNILLIKESETCLILLKINTTSDCPTLGQLQQWDTSNPKIAGKIIQEPNGQWTRTKAQVSQWWNFINKAGNPVVCVECDFDYSLIDHAQMIILEPKGFAFPTSSSYTYENSTESYWNGTMELTRAVQIPQQFTTYVINHDRYLYPDCTTADLVFSPEMMSDTIASMDNNCRTTNLNLTSTISVPILPFDFAHSNWYHGQKWLENVTASISNQNCITHICANLASDPYHNKGFGWN